MVTDIKLKEVPKKQLAIQPKKFILWLFMVSIVMVFAALTSGFIVRQAEGNWLAYALPSQLWVSTCIILLSSGTAIWALKSSKSGNLTTTRTGLILTLLLGLAFLVTQFWVWSVLVDNKIYFVGNPAGSFLYVLMGVHAFHLLSGLLYLLIMLIRAYKVRSAEQIQFHLGLSTTYWHFLTGLWVYLYVFLIIYH